jgi:hypothetical protein
MSRLVALFTVLIGLLGFAAQAEAGMQVNVDLAAQRMQVTTSDGESYSWPISSGRDGYRTIRGNFRPYRLEKNWYSRKYGGAMPNAVFFRGGFAVHGTTAVNRLGRPASHGCVRLAPGNAAKFYKLVQKHGKGATSIAIYGTPNDQPTRYAKAKPKSETVKLAKSRVKPQAPNWETARGQLLLRQGLPAGAYGYQPYGNPYYPSR